MTGRAIRRPLEGDDTAVGRAVMRNDGALTNCCDLGSVAFETLRPQRRLLKSFSPKMERRIAEVRRSERVNCLLPSRVQRLTRRFPHSIPYVATDVTAATLIGSLLSVVGRDHRYRSRPARLGIVIGYRVAASLLPGCIPLRLDADRGARAH